MALGLWLIGHVPSVVFSFSRSCQANDGKSQGSHKAEEEEEASASLRAHVESILRQMSAGTAPPAGLPRPFLAQLWTFILDWGSPHSGPHSFQSLPSLNSPGSLQTQGCWPRVGGEHWTDVLCGPEPS